MLVKRTRRYGCVVYVAETDSANIFTYFKAPFLCRWANCQRQFSMEQERDVHLERHTIRPLPCPFSGKRLLQETDLR
jgi:hypothetical protein